MVSRLVMISMASFNGLNKPLLPHFSHFSVWWVYVPGHGWAVFIWINTVFRLLYCNVSPASCLSLYLLRTVRKMEKINLLYRGYHFKKLNVQIIYNLLKSYSLFF